MKFFTSFFSFFIFLFFNYSLLAMGPISFSSKSDQELLQLINAKSAGYNAAIKEFAQRLNNPLRAQQFFQTGSLNTGLTPEMGPLVAQTMLQGIDVKEKWSQNLMVEKFLLGHITTIIALSVSPDGKYAAAASYDNIIRIWDLYTGKEIIAPLRCDSQIKSLSFSHNSKYIAACSLDKEDIWVWDISNQKYIKYSKPKTQKIPVAVGFADNDTCLIAYPGKIVRWNIKLDSYLTIVLQDNTKRNNSYSDNKFSNDGRYFFINVNYSNLQLWDAKTGTQIIPLTTSEMGICFSTDSNYFASTKGYSIGGYTICVTNLKNKTCNTFDVNNPVQSAACLSTDGKFFTCIGFENGRSMLQIWDVQTKKLCKSFQTNAYQLESISFTPDEKYIVFTPGEKVGLIKLENTEMKNFFEKYITPEAALLCTFLNKNINLSNASLVSALRLSQLQNQMYLPKNICQKFEQCKLAHNSPSHCHLYNHNLETNHQTFTQKENLNVLFDQLIAKEKELNAQGYYTFIHGQMRRFYLPERFFTHLWGLRKKHNVENFFFAHVKDLIEDDIAKVEQKRMRKEIKVNGTAYTNGTIDKNKRQRVLFMNYAFFANSRNPGSSSAYYIGANTNSFAGSSIQVSCKDSFAKLGYEWVYAKYKTDIEQLAYDYENLAKSGNALLIAVPKNRIHKYVYLAHAGGPKRVISIDGIGNTTDIRLIMETLLYNPEKIKDTDELEFCLIMTQEKGGLDPSTGIQMYPFISGDAVKVKELKVREDELLAKITPDILVFERNSQSN